MPIQRVFRILAILLLTTVPSRGQDHPKQLYLAPIKMEVPSLKDDMTVQYDYDIVYVRAPRFGDDKVSKWAEIAHPALMDAGADLMLLHPDGAEELLVAGGDDGAIADLMVSFDGQCVYFSHIQGLKGTNQHGPPPRGGADIFKIHIPSRR